MRTPSQKRYAEKNKELLRTKDARKNHHNPLRDAQNRNQRNSDIGWRMMRWGQILRHRLAFDYEQLSIISTKELQNPCFIFVLGGKQCYESLYAPLPSFCSKPS